MRKQRRKTKLSERLMPCQCCGYPISQRHHLFNVAAFGEHTYVRYLCANYHELFHIIDNDTKPRGIALRIAVENALGPDDRRLTYLTALVHLTRAARPEAIWELSFMDIINSLFPSKGEDE